MKHSTPFTISFNSLCRVVMLMSLFFLGSFGGYAAFVSSNPSEGAFPLVSNGKAASLCVSVEDYAGVQKVVGHLKTDLGKVTGVEPEIVEGNIKGKYAVIIGTIGKSPLIDQLVKSEAIDISSLEGKWDTFSIETVNQPFDGVQQALVVVGSNKRGTIYGMYEISRQSGVSPWYWWADAPVQESKNLYVAAGSHSMGEPKVKYRGIFLNDEAPALSGWVEENFGSFNHEFYEKVYELILRNRGNYLWPAMWPPKAFFDDDPENFRLADEMGVVISTSHHEPMMRSHEEWYRFGGKEWNYETNKAQLQEFWKTGFERTKDYEGVVTMGMRGDGDKAMGEDTAVGLLQDIIADQRSIIEDVTGKPAAETPQVWALYKEVQDYWDKGMRVPEDVMVLLCDDNWGNVRILPKAEDRDREGGFGIYYHFDFVGGPVSYRWINVTQIEKVWEQMNLCWDWGVRDLWLVNVGDLKPMEFPISFFLDMAWDPDAMKASDLPQYYVDWATEQFGETYSQDVAEILMLQTKYNARRTPEMIKPETYSLMNYREADTVVSDYKELVEKAKALYDALPESHKSAFYQLVLFPAEASSNINEMMVAAAKNDLYSAQGRASANYYADLVKACFEKDAELTRYYHEELESGKWNHTMAQTHIGYTSWNNPPVNKMPAVSWTHPQANPALGVMAEMGEFKNRREWALPTFDRLNDQEYFVEIFNAGSGTLNYEVDAKENWIKLSSTEGDVEFEEKVYVTIDWNKVPVGESTGSLQITGAGQSTTVTVPIRNEKPASVGGFIENNGVVSIEAGDYCRSSSVGDIEWTLIPNMGRTASSMTVEPSNAEVQKSEKGAPVLEYDFTLWNAGAIEVQAYLSPSLNYKKEDGLKFAVSIDDQEPKIVNIHEGDVAPDWEYPAWWNNSVTDHVRVKRSSHQVSEAGKHTLKIWMVDPGVVFQKFVIDAGGLKPSYLGPLASKKVGKK